MEIKRRIGFYLQKTYGLTKNTEEQIRMRVSWDGNIQQFNVGHKVLPSKWVTASGRCKPNFKNLKGVSSNIINKQIQQLSDVADEVFKRFEVDGITPTKEAFKDAFNEAIGKNTRKASELTLQIAFSNYISERAKVASWEDSTIDKHLSISRILCDWNRDILLCAFDAKQFESYHDYLLKRGLQNSSIKKQFSFIRAFLKWANEKDYLKTDWKSYRPEIKLIHKKPVIFLTWDELMKVYGLKFNEDKNYLERAKDCFCFECFTGLRFSDLKGLKRKDVHDDFIEFATEKTDTIVHIELNKYSRAILKKYEGEDLKGYALPVPSNPKLNEYIKEICFIAELNESITRVYYKGTERIEETLPKWQMVGTHTGRRTFICNALMLGISPEVVMSWTGHADYKQMMPYISVANETKKRSMSLFDK